MRIIRFLGALSTGWILFGAGVSAAVSFTPLGDLTGDPSSVAGAISADGRVIVGQIGAEAFRWNAGSGVEILGRPRHAQEDAVVIPTDVSADGTTVVGTTRNFGLNIPTAWRWTGETGIQRAGDEPFVAFVGEASGVSGDGTELVGHRGTGNFTHADATLMPYSLLGGGQILPRPPLEIDGLPGDTLSSKATAISDDGTRIALYRHFHRELELPGSSTTVRIVGSEAYRAVFDGIETEVTALPDLPGSIASRPFAISGDGSTIVGSSYTSGAGQYAVRWDAEGRVHALAPRNPSGTSRALATSHDGSTIVGTDGRAFVWDEAHGLRDLRVLLEGLGLDLDGWTLLEATDVSADGRTIVGLGEYRGDDPIHARRESFIVVIPEPSTALMMVLGLAGLCIQGRRHVSGPARVGGDPSRWDA